MSGDQDFANNNESLSDDRSLGDTISECPTLPMDEHYTHNLKNAKNKKRKKSSGNKSQTSSKEEKMVKQNVTIDAYHRELDITLPNNAIGRDLFEEVIGKLDLKEVWFFGLEYRDSKNSPTWLKLKKKVFSQDVGKKRPLRLLLKPKFYPEDVEKELMDSVSKKLFLEHVKRDVISGELYCGVDTAVLLASFALQEQYGDYNVVLNPKGFLHNQQVLPQKVTEQYEIPMYSWEEKIVNLYKDHRGMSKDQATMEYLRIAQDLEMFGVNYFKIKNKKGTTLWLGVDALGMNVYEKANKLEPKTGFPWNEIKAISYRDKRFTVKPIDITSPNFVFFTDRAKTNKLILVLCMGNHELFIRRRKIDVAPKQRNSSARLTDINVIAEEELDQIQSTSYDSTGRIDRKMSIEMSPEPSLPDSPSPIQNGIHEDSEEEEERYPINAYETADLKEEDTDHEEQERETGPEPSAVEPEYATVGEKNSDADVHIAPDVYTPPTAPSPPPERKISQVSYQESETKVEITIPTTTDTSNLKQNSVYEPMGSPSLSALVEEVPKSPDASTVGSESNFGSFRVSDSVEKARGSREYVALLQKYEAGGDEDSHLHREAYVPENKDAYYKAKNLFEEVTKDPSKLSEEDMINLKLKGENIDKYQTLRKIRSGYTRDRIAIFEAMM